MSRPHIRKACTLGTLASLRDGTNLSEAERVLQDNAAAGSHVVTKHDLPGLVGPTLADVENLKDVP